MAVAADLVLALHGCGTVGTIGAMVDLVMQVFITLGDLEDGIDGTTGVGVVSDMVMLVLDGEVLTTLGFALQDTMGMVVITEMVMAIQEEITPLITEEEAIITIS